MKKILIAEDDMAYRETLTAALEAENYSVVAVENGEEALKILASDSFDLLADGFLYLGRQFQIFGKQFVQIDLGHLTQVKLFLLPVGPDHDDFAPHHAIAFGPVFSNRLHVALNPLLHFFG